MSSKLIIHYKNLTACGSMWNSNYSHKKSEVTCGNCKRTKAFKSGYHIDFFPVIISSYEISYIEPKRIDVKADDEEWDVF